MKLLKFGLLFAIFLSVGFSTAPPLARFVEILHNFENKYTPEKTYIHTDKPFYTSEETIWFKSYLVDGGTHKATTKSNVLHVELINPKDSIVYKTKLFVDQNTFGTAGDIKINKNWESGKYQLRAYTHYMIADNEGYYFRKQIQIEKTAEKNTKLDFFNLNKFPEITPISDKIIAVKNASDLQINFYPEGGTLLANHPNKFGIKAIDNNNNGIAIEGIIKEKDKNEIVSMFRTFDFGLGQAAFTPKHNVQYVAEISVNGTKKIVNLPMAIEKVENLSVTNNQDHLILQAATGFENLNGYFIIGHVRGHVFYTQEISKKEKTTKLKLVTKNFPRGISHFTLFDPYGNPKCERLVFINAKNKNSNPKIVTNKKEYKKREKVGYNIEIPNTSNTNLSLAITQKSVIPLAINETIESWLLLNSDLRGEIPSAAAFFDPKKKQIQRDFLLESLMLTHGWRRFTWNELYKNAYNKKENLPEKGIKISGYAFAENPEFNDQKIETNLVFLDKNPFSEKQFTTSKHRFEYGPFVVKDSLKTILQAKMPETKEKYQKKVTIVLDNEKESPKILPLPQYNLKKETLFFENYKKIQSHINLVNFNFNGVNQLNEVIISGKAKRTESNYDDIASDLGSYGFPSNRMILDSIIGTSSTDIFDLLIRVPGVSVSGSIGNHSVSIRNSNTGTTPTGNNIDQINNPLLDGNPLFLLDGNRVDITFIENLQGSDISFIDVLKGNDTAIFGSQGANGVIAIYLKKNTTVKITGKSPGIINFLTHPFYKAKEFFSPDYFNDKSNPKPDYRTTLYWNPNINIESDKIENNYFYTSDQTGKFQIEIQGITNNGELIYAIEEFEVVD